MHTDKYNFSDVEWLIVTVAMIGKFAISVSFAMAWTYSVEVYPTSIRAIGVNACSSAARASGIAAAYVGILVCTIYPSSHRLLL